LSFTEWLESLTPLVNLVRVLAGVGLVTIMLANLKRAAEKRCWQKYKALVEIRIDYLIKEQNRHPKELTELEWKVECERLLTDARFGPMEVQQVLEPAVIVAKGIAADKVLFYSN